LSQRSRSEALTRPEWDGSLTTEFGRVAWTRSTSPGRTRPFGRVPGVAGLALGLAAVAAAWWLLAPAQLGGSTAFTTVDGTSMEPTFQRSDLVALRASKTYRVGDIAGYHSTLLGRVVLHRIVAMHDGRYRFKGDHNSFVDPEQPARGQLVGRLWFTIPKAGRAVESLHTPWIVAVVAALLVVALLGGGTPTSRERDSS
jgi:signal peptidase I